MGLKAKLLMTALLVSVALPVHAEASLFERMGIAAPQSAQSQLLVRAVYSPVTSAPSTFEPVTRSFVKSAAAEISSPVKFEPAAASSTVQSQPVTLAATSADYASPTIGMNADVAAPILLAKAEPEAEKRPMSKKTTGSMPPIHPWTNILMMYVSHGPDDVNLFDYARLAKTERDMKALDAYIEDLASMSPSAMKRNDAMAYWANLYNALTVQVVVKNWPVKSIKEIKSGTFTPGPWKRKLVTVEGKALTLDDIEHGILRKDFADPRIHYMVNCASIGCPNLEDGAWDARYLERNMDRAAKRFINSERGAKVENGKLTVSSIYKWFVEDFGGNNAGVIAHLKQYADDDLKAQLDGITKISKDQYNWDVNAK